MKPSIDSIARRYLELHPAGFDLFLDFDGYTVRLRSNSGELIARLADYFREFLDQGREAGVTLYAIEAPSPTSGDLGLQFTIKTPDPGKTKIKEEFADLPGGRVIRKIQTGMVYLLGQDSGVALGPCLKNDNQVVNFINNHYIAWELDRGSLLFHAAGVARRGKGLALAGFSGMGKSSLALYIMTRGTDFVSNDRLMVRRTDKGLAMCGIAKMPRINPGTVLNNPVLECVMPEADRRRFESLSRGELWNLEHKYDAFIDECFGKGRFRIRAEMTGLVLLNWKMDSSEPMTVKPVDLSQRPEIFTAFMKDLGLFYSQPGTSANSASPGDYLALLEGCPVYELSGRVDFQAAAAFCADLLPRD